MLRRSSPGDLQYFALGPSVNDRPACWQSKTGQELGSGHGEPGEFLSTPAQRKLPHDVLGLEVRMKSNSLPSWIRSLVYRGTYKHLEQQDALRLNWHKEGNKQGGKMRVSSEELRRGYF